MSKHKSTPPLSPEKYIRTRARTLPLGLCYINEKWKETGMGFVLVTRKHTNGNLTFGGFQVDLHCLGVKDAFCNFNFSPVEIDNLIQRKNSSGAGDSMIEIDYVLAHNIIYGAVEFAEDLGFKPHKNFDLAQKILEEDDEKIELIEIEFGLNGIPAVYLGKEQHPQNIIAQLERSVGRGNFLVMDPENKFRKYVDLPDSENEFYPECDEIEEEEENDDDLPVIDKPFDELTEEDFEDAYSGRKKFSACNLFMIAFAMMVTDVSKKERKEIDQIVERIESWNISDEIVDELSYMESDEEVKLLKALAILVESDAAKAIQSLLEAIKKFPGNLSFYELLNACYKSTGETDLLFQLNEEICRKFPDDVMSTGSYLHLLILSNKMVEFDKQMHPSFDIHKQFPGRTCFTPIEMLSFLVPIITYYFEKGEIQKAAAYTFELTNYDWEGFAEKAANLYFELVGARILETLPNKKSWWKKSGQ